VTDNRETCKASGDVHAVSVSVDILDVRSTSVDDDVQVTSYLSMILTWSPGFALAPSGFPDLTTSYFKPFIQGASENSAFAGEAPVNAAATRPSDTKVALSLLLLAIEMALSCEFRFDSCGAALKADAPASRATQSTTRNEGDTMLLSSVGWQCERLRQACLTKRGFKRGKKRNWGFLGRSLLVSSSTHVPQQRQRS
jgi:hypothetical protein